MKLQASNKNLAMKQGTLADVKVCHIHCPYFLKILLQMTGYYFKIGERK